MMIITGLRENKIKKAMVSNHRHTKSGSSSEVMVNPFSSEEKLKYFVEE